MSSWINLVGTNVGSWIGRFDSFLSRVSINVEQATYSVGQGYWKLLISCCP